MTSFFLKPSPVYFTEILKDSAKKNVLLSKIKTGLFTRNVCLT